MPFVYAYDDVAKLAQNTFQLLAMITEHHFTKKGALQLFLKEVFSIMFSDAQFSMEMEGTSFQENIED